MDIIFSSSKMNSVHYLYLVAIVTTVTFVPVSTIVVPTKNKSTFESTVGNSAIEVDHFNASSSSHNETNVYPLTNKSVLSSMNAGSTKGNSLSSSGFTGLSAASNRAYTYARNSVSYTQGYPSSQQTQTQQNKYAASPPQQQYSVPTYPHPLKTKTYAIPPQYYNAQPVTYVPPHITFHPPKIIVTESGITFAQSQPPYEEQHVPYSSYNPRGQYQPQVQSALSGNPGAEYQQSKLMTEGSYTNTNPVIVPNPQSQPVYQVPVSHTKRERRYPKKYQQPSSTNLDEDSDC